jgi:hypothetical protein
MPHPETSEAYLFQLQKNTFKYFVYEANSGKGLIKDNTQTDSPASITAIGLGLAAYIIAVKRGFIAREEAVERTLKTLQFLWGSPQNQAPDATGYKGFYYHFLDMDQGRRVWKSELSSIDSTFLITGVLTTSLFYTHPTKDECEIRDLADALYRRVDWQWMLNEESVLSHGWKPESGFLRARWTGYNEALVLYLLALGSPTYPIPKESYSAWLQTYRWKAIYDYQFVYSGPLFIHQLSHLWVDFRGIQDEYMWEKKIDYFENSRRATLVQQEYARRNPKGFKGYNEKSWGITASAGPGPITKKINGRTQNFYGYRARGVPFGPDDGTLSPWAVIASLPFAPEEILPTIRYIDENYPEIISKYGFKCSFNPTLTLRDSERNIWISEGYYGLDQGPIILMIENYLSGFLWELWRECPYLITGLRRAGFRGGWLTAIL